MNISSVVVKCSPKFLKNILDSLENSDICEIYQYDEDGRIVVIIEGESTETESEKLSKIQAMEHVLSAEMVYAYSESEFAANEGQFDRVANSLIETLNADLPAEEIVYRGHLKDK